MGQDNSQSQEEFKKKETLTSQFHAQRKSLQVPPPNQCSADGPAISFGVLCDAIKSDNYHNIAIKILKEVTFSSEQLTKALSIAQEVQTPENAATYLPILRSLIIALKKNEENTASTGVCRIF